MPADFKITTRISLDFIHNKWQQLEQYGNAAAATAAARLQFQRFPIYLCAVKIEIRFHRIVWHEGKANA